MDFSALSQTYGGMTRPAYALKVGGTELQAGGDVRLLRAECELTCRQSAGYLLVEAVMDPDGKHGSAWLDALQAGARCSFSLGYGSRLKEVFRGFLCDVTWEDPLAQGALRVEAVFLDVRGLLMTSSCADGGSARTMSQLIQTILGQSCCTQLASSRTVQAVPEEWDLPVQRWGDSDYDVVCRAASFLCYEFYVWAGELYFGKPRPQPSPAVTFQGPGGLMEFRRRRTLSGQWGAVSICGGDDGGQRLCARRARTRDKGFGAGQMGSALSGALEQAEEAVRTMAQAQYLARARMEARQRQAGDVEGRCLGVPELRPGRFLSVSGLSRAVNGAYYVHTVRHTLDERGYETYFEGEE